MSPGDVNPVAQRSKLVRRLCCGGTIRKRPDAYAMERIARHHRCGRRLCRRTLRDSPDVDLVALGTEIVRERDGIAERKAGLHDGFVTGALDRQSSR
jgi:hypothetical protein